MKKILAVLMMGILVSGASAWGSGLSIPEQGSAAMGMSAAMTARNEDLSAIYYNPAGLDYVQGFEIMVGDTPIIPRHKFIPYIDEQDIFDKAETKSTVFLPPQLYAAWRMNSTMVLGVGVNAPFGLGTDWDDDTWTGRYNSTYAEITLINVNPTFTWIPTDVVSVGVGMSYAISTATIEKMIDTGASISPALMANTNYDSNFGLEGDGTGYGFNFGVLYKPRLSNYQLGLSYRSAMDIEYEGTAKFTHQETNIKNAVAASAMAGGADAATAALMAEGAYAQIAGMMPPDQDGTATMHLPWILSAGLKSQMSEVWDVSADINVVGWKVYENLTIDFADDKPSDEIVQDKDWGNSIVLRTGTSYVLNDRWTVRGGIMYDFNPVPRETFDSQLPDSDRYGLSVGTGYQLGNIRLDASYLFLKFRMREKDNAVGWSTDTTGDGIVDRFDVPANYPLANGKYKSLAHLVSLSMSYQF